MSIIFVTISWITFCRDINFVTIILCYKKLQVKLPFRMVSFHTKINPPARYFKNKVCIKKLKNKGIYLDMAVFRAVCLPGHPVFSFKPVGLFHSPAWPLCSTALSKYLHAFWVLFLIHFSFYSPLVGARKHFSPPNKE